MRQGAVVSRFPIYFALMLAFSTPAAEIEIGPGDNLITTAQALDPGDVLILQGGTYTVTNYFPLLINGTPAQPIVIRAKSGQTPTIYRPDASQNLIDITATHLIIEGLTFVGGSRGLTLTNASDLTIRNCEISGTAAPAINASNAGVTYSRLRIEQNRIHNTGGTGEGMYLGCTGNTCRVTDSVIRGNYIYDLNDDGVSQGEGIDLKEGSYANVIADNVIHDTYGACIVINSTLGNGSDNLIERNAVWNCGDYGIQAVSNALVRNNIVWSAASAGIVISPRLPSTPTHIEISHNTVVQPVGNTLSLLQVAGPIGVFNNALYSQSGAAISATGVTANVTASGNAGKGALSGVATGFNGGGNLTLDLLASGYADTSPGNVFPRPGSLLMGAADAAHLEADDFNQTPRAGDLTAGAYVFDSDGNPGWIVGEGIKPPPLLSFKDGFEDAPP